MKTKFEWYINPSNEEIDSIWKDGILTVDTNVLLDLYRYHEDTRKSLIEGIRKFNGEKWLTHQAAKEFFRNRNKVIISSEKTFKQAQEEIDRLKQTLDSVVSQLKSIRIIPSNINKDLGDGISPLIDNTYQLISEAKDSYPKFLQNDPILEELIEIFEGAVGEDFSEEEKPKITSEAQRRKENKIPPGYLDNDKDNDRPYGDYYLWLQVMNYAKEKQKPIVFVTSERKEDWWEKISGKITGLRPELLQEAKLFSGQRIVVYQTERFLEYFQSRNKELVNKTAIEEIKEINELRTRSEVAVKLVEQKIISSDKYFSSGEIILELRRPLWNFTVSGRLNPIMHSIPTLEVEVLESPEQTPLHRINGRTGTVYDFNINLVSNNKVENFPVGRYVFSYKAKSIDNQHIDEQSISLESYQE